MHHVKAFITKLQHKIDHTANHLVPFEAELFARSEVRAVSKLLSQRMVLGSCKHHGGNYLSCFCTA